MYHGSQCLFEENMQTTERPISKLPLLCCCFGDFSVFKQALSQLRKKKNNGKGCRAQPQEQHPHIQVNTQPPHFPQADVETWGRTTVGRLLCYVHSSIRLSWVLLKFLNTCHYMLLSVCIFTRKWGGEDYPMSSFFYPL